MGQSSGIGVLDKAVKVLRASAVAPLGLADLCATTGLPRATAHRLAVGLEVHGLLTRDGQGRWRPGPLLATLAAGAPDPLVSAATEVLAAWADAATQHAVLAEAVFTERGLAEVRRRGWAQSVAEREMGVASVSAPVRDRAGAVVAAISVSGPVDRIGRRPGIRWAGDLVDAADALTAR